jgi:recombinational DNA repair protein RecR
LENAIELIHKKNARIEILNTVLNEQPQIVRCKDCKHRGNADKCVIAAIAKEKDYPIFMIDNRGEWYCADGEARQ